MKTHGSSSCRLFLLVGMVIAFLAPFEVVAQDDYLVCGTKFNPKLGAEQGALLLDPEYGIYIPSSGTRKVLLVFVSYPNDVRAHASWPPHQPPSNMYQYIDSTATQNSSNFSNLTNYFRQMSRTVYTVIGKPVWVEAPHDSLWYWTNGYLRGAVNKDVLQYRVDPLVNFAEYDNWRRTANYTFLPEPDGLVDMIVMCWRGSQWGILGEASMGPGATDLPVDGKTIKFGYPGYGGGSDGSGVFVSFPYSKGPEKNLQNMAHEMGHWLLGSPHPYSDAGSYSVWAVLGAQQVCGVCMNTYERERLNWVDPITVTDTDCLLGDFITTGVAYKYHPPNGAANEYYYFENHQKLSVYDDASLNANDKGIWAIHQLAPYNQQDNIRIKPADGFYNWDSPGTSSLCYSQTLRYFKKTAVNPNPAGWSFRDFLPFYIPGQPRRWWVYVYQDEYNVLHCGDYAHGEGSFGAYNLTYSNVFSRWSNPPANCWYNAVNDFAMNVTAQNGSVVTVHFYLGARDTIGPPSRPQWLRAGPSPNNHVRLAWAANGETDLTGYKVYRKMPSEQNFSLRATVPKTQLYWDDPECFWRSTQPYQVAQYYLKAYDSQALESSPSDVEIATVLWAPPKISFEAERPNIYSLEQNYPNPFNPTTALKFGLPEPGEITLMVYDALGRESLILAEGFHEAGSYSVRWDGSAFSSGVYFARLIVKDALGNFKFHSVSKMLLVK